MLMREILDRLNEAAYAGSTTFWYHPGTQTVIPASDHGTAVHEDPDAFGIPQEIIWQVEEAMPYGYDESEAENLDEPLDHDALPPLPDEIWGGSAGWSRDDVWEILAMNRGWVRCGLAVGTGGTTYMSAERTRSILVTAKKFHDRLGKQLEAEIVSKRGNAMTTFAGTDLAAFLESTPAQAEAMIKRG